MHFVKKNNEKRLSVVYFSEACRGRNTASTNLKSILATLAKSKINWISSMAIAGKWSWAQTL